MIAAACLVVTAQAWAGTDVGSLLVGGPNFFEQGGNREYLIDRDFTTAGSPGFGKKGQIDAGDSLRGLFNISVLNASSANLGGLTPITHVQGVRLNHTI